MEADSTDIEVISTKQPRRLGFWGVAVRILLGIPFLVFLTILALFRKAPSFRIEFQKLFELSDDQLLYIELAGWALLLLTLGTVWLIRRLFRGKREEAVH